MGTDSVSRAFLFVYGTLMARHAEGGVLAHVPREEAWVEGRLYDLPAGYPALVLPSADDPRPRPQVWGELAGPFDARILGILDAYEGVEERLYARVSVEVAVDRVSPTRTAWVYVMDAARARRGRLLPSGRWRPLRRR